MYYLNSCAEGWVFLWSTALLWSNRQPPLFWSWNSESVCAELGLAYEYYLRNVTQARLIRWKTAVGESVGELANQTFVTA